MKKNSFRQLSQILDILVRKYGVDRKLKEYQALSDWNDVVGTKISKISKVVKISDGKLFIEVSNSSWRAELLLMKPQIIEKINKRIGTQVLKDIVFV
jgi:predicted nucleic acid-binding Zn ribbon protein